MSVDMPAGLILRRKASLKISGRTGSWKDDSGAETVRLGGSGGHEGALEKEPKNRPPETRGIRTRSYGALLDPDIGVSGFTRLYSILADGDVLEK